MKTSNKGANINEQELTNYLQEFASMTGAIVPERAKQFLLTRQFERLLGKNAADYLVGYEYDSEAILEFDLEKMKMLIDFSNDGYFKKARFLPLMVIEDQTAYIGVKANEKDSQIYFFDYQDGFFEQEFTLDELLNTFE